MAQAVLTYLIVAAAAAWTLWSMFLRGWVRARRARRTADRAAAPGCGKGCGCAD